MDPHACAESALATKSSPELSEMDILLEGGFPFSFLGSLGWLGDPGQIEYK